MGELIGVTSGGRFAGTASYYARFRPGYPRVLFDEVVRHFRLDGAGRLLDLGCGTGQLVIPLAEHFAEAVGMDREPEMIDQAARRARAAQAAKVTWVCGDSHEMPDDLGSFRLVTMGRSFHWMDRELVLDVLDDMVDAGGGLVIAHDWRLPRPVTAWQRAVAEVQRRFVGPIPECEGRPPAEPHEAVLARSPFQDVVRAVHEFERSWTVERITGYLYSTSLPPLRRLLGERRPAFERELTDALSAADPTGRFIEPAVLEVLMARRPQAVSRA
ncbi:class I SAM-dependent methyltransferase [Actinomadura sp. 9N215]|uniref:class I SAM-dependent methyltransferase n=1 Tax=Actinomadura sp. 9N215 TaxID=3375150 RepID=UPI0037AD0789